MYPRYSIDPKRRQAAIERADLMFIEENSENYSWFNCFVGVVGEHAVYTYFDKQNYGIRQGGKRQHDLELQATYNKIIRIEVKTICRTVRCEPSFEVNLAARQVVTQHPDVYVFCSAYFTPTKDSAHCQEVEIVGWETRKNVIECGKLLPVGAKFGSGKEVQRESYSILVNELRPITNLAQMVTA